MLVTLATLEAAIRRIKVQNLPWTNRSGNPASKRLMTKKGWQSGSRMP
jgi:hypothetical protein